MSFMWPIVDMPFAGSDIIERIRARIAGSSILVDIEPHDGCEDAEPLIDPILPLVSELGLGLSPGSLANANVGAPTSTAPATIPATTCTIERTAI